MADQPRLAATPSQSCSPTLTITPSATCSISTVKRGLPAGLAKLPGGDLHDQVVVAAVDLCAQVAVVVLSGQCACDGFGGQAAVIDAFVHGLDYNRFTFNFEKSFIMMIYVESRTGFQ